MERTVLGVEVIGVLSVRVKEEERKKEWNYYDNRHADDDGFEPVTVEGEVRVNHFGTLVTKEPINLGRDGYKNLSGQEKDVILGII